MTMFFTYFTPRTFPSSFQVEPECEMVTVLMKVDVQHVTAIDHSFLLTFVF